MSNTPHFWLKSSALCAMQTAVWVKILDNCAHKMILRSHLTSMKSAKVMTYTKSSTTFNAKFYFFCIDINCDDEIDFWDTLLWLWLPQCFGGWFSGCMKNNLIFNQTVYFFGLQCNRINHIFWQYPFKQLLVLSRILARHNAEHFSLTMWSCLYYVLLFWKASNYMYGNTCVMPINSGDHTAHVQYNAYKYKINSGKSFHWQRSQAKL